MHPPSTILIIDDNPTNLEVLYSTLIQAGYDVLVEMDGKSGIEQAKTNCPDLILLDVMMPGISGFETCQQLQADSSTQAIPVIFMTALSDVAEKVKGLSLGAVDYITKPFQQEEVLARIQVQLKLRCLSQELEQKNQQLEQYVEERTAKLTATLEELKAMQLQLVQSEKMSSIGQLVAGIAHEINNPLGFISGNLEQATIAIQDLIDCLELYRATFPQPGAAIAEKIEGIDLDYLLQDIPKMLKSMQVGVDRIHNISTSLRTFSRTDADILVCVDVHEGLESTLMILQHRLKANQTRPKIEVIKHYGNLPKVQCYLGQLNQVFMNILSNAIDALEESNPPNPSITIRSESINADTIAIYIADNAAGISENVQQKLFEPFFTTKSVGKGTGLGLSISYQIITEKHNGRLTCASTIGQGTEFMIQLPTKTSL